MAKKDALGQEIMRLAWLRENLRYMHVNHKPEPGRYVNWSRGGNYISSSTIMRIVDTAIKFISVGDLTFSNKINQRVNAQNKRRRK